MSDTAPPAWFSTFALLGGSPLRAQDLAASIVLTLCYALLLPVALYRLLSLKSRALVLVRVVDFCAVRIATWIIRAVQSGGTSYSTGLFIAELIMLYLGAVLLVEPLLTLVTIHVTSESYTEGRRVDFTRVLRLLRLALLVALILGVYSGSRVASLDDPSSVSQVKAIRLASTIITAVLTLATAFILIFAHRDHDRLEPAASGILLAIALILSIPSVYRIVIYSTSPPPNPLHRGTKIAFYLLSALPEFIAASHYLSVNLEDMFHLDAIREPTKDVKGTRDGGGFLGREEQVEMLPR